MTETKTFKRLPALQIDFSKDIDTNLLCPLTDASMASALGNTRTGWTAEKVRVVNAAHGLFSDVPCKCLGKTPEMSSDPDTGQPVEVENSCCPYSKYCPFEDAIVENAYKNGACPVELVTAFKYWAGYIIELEISPEDFTDWQLVVDLVRLHIMQRRLDLYMKDIPIWEKKIAAVNQRSGKVHYDKVPNLAYQMHREVRQDIQQKYMQLVASRDSKVKRDSLLKDGSKPTDLFENIQKRVKEVETRRIREAKQAKKEAIDAEFTAEDKEDG